MKSLRGNVIQEESISQIRGLISRQEQMLSSRPTAALGRLAKETGGFLLENTNDLGAASLACSRNARRITCWRISP